jgi:hypothetical protein
MSISHSREDESLKAKTRWFQSLPVEERMRMLCEFTDLALSINPDLAKKKRVQSITGRVRVLTKE